MLETLVTVAVWGFCFGFGFEVARRLTVVLHAILRYLFTGQIG